MLFFLKQWLCKHEWTFVRNIYGDEINAAGGMRSVWKCQACNCRRLGPNINS